MANQTITNEGYYRGSQTFLGNGSATTFTLSTTNFDPLPKEEGEFNIYINNVIQSASTYSYVASTGVITFTTAPTSGATVSVELGDWDRELGSYQSIKLNMCSIIGNVQPSPNKLAESFLFNIFVQSFGKPCNLSSSTCVKYLLKNGDNVFFVKTIVTNAFIFHLLNLLLFDLSGLLSDSKRQKDLS